MKATIEKLTKWRAEVEALQKERDELKSKVGDASSGRMSSAQIEMFRSALQAMRTEVVAYLKEKGDFEEEVAGASSGPTLVQMTIDTIQERKQYFVTTDIAKLKAEWEEAELGPLDDEDFQLYLGREVKSLDVEEDDDTVNVRFDNHDTQWFPVTCLFQKVEGPVAVATGPVKVQMNMDTIRERKYYFVTEDMTQLKTHWEEAELGPLDDEDFQLYLGRKVYAIDLEEDDDTMNVRFDNHDTQWFPVCCLYEEQEGVAPVAAAPTGPNAGKTMMGMDNIAERKKYFITEDLAELKAKWEEAELGPLDDEDFEKYLGREVYAIDLEEDDDTMNVRFDNHDTQWFPVSCLYQAGAAPAPSKPKRTQMNMDTIKERQYYFVTDNMAELKKDWEAAELGPLDVSSYPGSFEELKTMIGMGDPEAEQFLNPASTQQNPQYSHKVQHPMDLNQVRERLIQGTYKNIAHYAADTRLVWENAFKFNDIT